MHFEQFFVGNVRDLLPDAEIVPAVAPVGLEILIVEIGQIAVEPAGQVDAVGHRVMGVPRPAAWARGCATSPARRRDAGG
jgi:hypothetical protein